MTVRAMATATEMADSNATEMTAAMVVLGRQANLKELLESKELAT